jgi:serine/threonine protein kinase
MTISSVANLVGVLRQARLLSPPQLDELSRELLGRFPQPRPLAQELLQRGWLTPFQLNQIFMGRAKDLVLGPYIILERLGEGAVGYVYKARHQHMQRVVAMKVIRKELLTDQEVVGRFYREIHAVSQLVHPNVITAYDAGPAGQTHFFAMEYVEGIDLVRLTKETGPLPVDQACDYIRQAALGLQHIHERGLVHRDIKPSNLLVAQSPGKASSVTQLMPPAGSPPGSSRWGLVKILDLGLARLTEPVNGAAQSPLTVAGGGLRGTADYLAPEQAIDFHMADIRSDIYSLGCAFYFLLTGRPPFDGGTLAQKLMKHQREAPPSVGKLTRNLPRRLPMVLARMMAKKPSDRFQNPAEAAEAIAGLHRRSWLSLWR